MFVGLFIFKIQKHQNGSTKCVKIFGGNSHHPTERCSKQKNLQDVMFRNIQRENSDLKRNIQKAKKWLSFTWLLIFIIIIVICFILASLLLSFLLQDTINVLDSSKWGYYHLSLLLSWLALLSSFIVGYDHTIKFWAAHSGVCTRTHQHPDSQVFNTKLVYLDIYFACTSWCPSICLPVCIQTAEMIGPKFCVWPHMTSGKVYRCLELLKVSCRKKNSPNFTFGLVKRKC